jgi:hypothetical protein
VPGLASEGGCMSCKYMKNRYICNHPDIEVGEFGEALVTGLYQKCPVEFGAHVCGLFEDNIFVKGAVSEKVVLMR